MNILMISSEAVPFSKSGGLADVVGALTSELVSMGHDARVMVPSYNVRKEDSGEYICTLQVPMLAGPVDVEIRQKNVGDTPYLFVCHTVFNDRQGIYGDTSFTPYNDNLYRFALLSKSALLYCIKTSWKPDIIHCHDWTSGFVPYFLKTHNSQFFIGTKTVFTIHNLAYQGTFARMDFLFANVKPSENLFLNGQINMMQAGLVYADFITTVSPTYAKEIQRPEQGCGLDAILKKRSKWLKGIVNGIDVNEWNPQSDKLIPYHFSLEDMSGKAKLKAEIQKQFNLPVAPRKPLVAMISRLASQKGFDALCQCLGDILATDRMQIIIIGTGDKTLEQRLKAFEGQYKNLSVNIMFSNKAAHLVEGGSDFFLMPSRYEPCGLNQLYSLRYGTIPIARRTGGLADTIVDVGENPDTGTGFLFDQLTPQNISNSVFRAVEMYENDKESLNGMIHRAMSGNFSWASSAKEYISVFEMTLLK